MRKCLLVVGLLSTFFIHAQTEKPMDKKEAINSGQYSIINTYPQKNVIVAQVGNDRNGYLFGLLDNVSRKNITPFIFESFISFTQSNFSPVKLNSKWGVINTAGQITIPCIYDDVTTLTVDSALCYIVRKGRRVGIINTRNESIVPFEYDYIRKGFSDLHLQIGKGGKIGLMNWESRKMVIPLIYERMQILSESQVEVQIGNRYSIFDVSGAQVLPNWYSQLKFNYSEKYAVATLNGRMGVVSLSGKEMIPFEYDELNDYITSEIFFIGAKGGKYGLFGSDGKVVLPAQYDMLNGDGLKMVIVTNNNKTGMVTPNGSTVFPMEYDEIVNMGSCFRLKKNNKYGFVGYSGNLILPVEYDTLCQLATKTYYNIDYLLVTRNGKKAIVDAETGKPLCDFIYDDLIGTCKSDEDLEIFDTTIIAVKNGRYGMIKMNGNVLVPFIYDELQYLNSDLVIAGKGGKYGIVDVYKNNNIVLPLQYQFVCGKNNTIIAYKNSYEKYSVTGNKLTKMAN